MEKKKSKLKIVLIVLGIVLILIVGCFIAANIYLSSLINNINIEEKIDEDELEISESFINSINGETSDSTNEEIVNKPHKILNIVLVENNDINSNQMNFLDDDQSYDEIKLLSLDYTDKDIKLTSINQDIIVYLPGNKQEYGHFNWSYKYGGSKLTIQTINYNMDLDTKDYITFSFTDLAQIVDVLGGVDIQLTKEEADILNGLAVIYKEANINVVEGMNHFNSNGALLYVGQGFMESGASGEYRKKIIIKTILNKIKEMPALDILKTVNECLPYIKTNLTASEIKDLLIDSVQFDIKNIQNYYYPNNDNSLYLNPDSIGGGIIRDYSQQVIDLHCFLYEVEKYTPSDVVRKTEEGIHSSFEEQE